MKRALGPSERIYPMPVPLVVGGSGDDIDLLAVAWIGVAGPTPPTIAMSLRNSRRTLELIRANGGELTINIPSTRLAKQVDYCGMVSGRTADKFAHTGLTPVPGLVVSTPIIAECPYNMECRISREVPLGEYSFILAEVLETHADEEVLAEDGKVDITKLDPLVYLAGVREYRGLTDVVAPAFTVRDAEEARLSE